MTSPGVLPLGGVLIRRGMIGRRSSHTRYGAWPEAYSEDGGGDVGGRKRKRGFEWIYYPRELCTPLRRVGV